MFRCSLFGWSVERTRKSTKVYVNDHTFLSDWHLVHTSEPTSNFAIQRQYSVLPDVRQLMWLFSAWNLPIEKRENEYKNINTNTTRINFSILQLPNNTVVSIHNPFVSISHKIECKNLNFVSNVLCYAGSTEQNSVCQNSLGRKIRRKWTNTVTIAPYHRSVRCCYA